MTSPSEDSFENPTIDDLRNNGIEVSDDSSVVENFAFQPEEFETCSVRFEEPMPAIIIQTRGGIFRAFSLTPVLSDRPRIFRIQEGTGSTAGEAKADCLAKTIGKFNSESETIGEYLRVRAATEGSRR